MPKRTQKALKKDQNTSPAVTEEISIEEVRESVVRGLRTIEDPDLMLQDAKEKKVYKNGFDPKKDDPDLSVRLLTTFSFENDHTLIHAVSPKYRGLSIELRRQLIKDFGCKTHAEKALVDTIVSGYIRHLSCTQAFNNCLAQGNTSAILNTFLGVMSTEMDRANRHLMTAYQMLVNLKKPPVKVQIKTQQAFVAHAQQFNSQKPE